MKQNPCLLLIITGGIAAYKGLELIRLLRRDDIEVIPVVTKSALEFITPLSIAGVAHQKVYHELFSVTDEMEMGHIALSRKADVILVYPATANFIAKAANGLADDLASTLLLATDKPVLMTPAMNVRMWHHPATQHNINMLKKRGITVFEPDSGSMACGEFGKGRLIEPLVMMEHLNQFFSQSTALTGKHVLITTGATQEAIDPVRYISNHSSGKQGFALATACRNAGAKVTVIAGHCSVSPPANMNIIKVKTADEMYAATLSVLPADIAICCAAVSDWTPLKTFDQKKKKQSDTLTIELKQTPDILASLAKHPQRPTLLIGFAAETEHGLEYAKQKRLKKGCDWLILNEINDQNPAFGSDDNQVTLITADTVIAFAKMAKQQLADKVVHEITNFLK